ncbi:MAG TPA: hypothetical protein VGM88_02055 [Kofleriaceae bacterium]|jgi:hypothetical protein
MRALLCLAILAACGGGGGDTGDDGGGGGGDDGGSGGSGDTFGGTFRHGMNDGHVNANFTDNQGGALGAAAGADSNRIKLPEYFLDQWGDDVRVDAAMSYQADGMSNLVCLLIGPSAAHSTDPTGDNLEGFIPKNLYEPIFLDDGSVNPDNYWGAYVAETVTTYKPYVRIWEIWNEPDWTPDYATTQGWATQAPTVADLPRFNGSIFDYIRMLRVSYAVVKHVDPTAQVALGGIGYPTFLDAILRYTDNPDGGAVTDAFPSGGGAYFDVLNFHYYPLYTPGNSDAGYAGLIAQHDAMAAELAKFDVTGKTFNATETGAPRVQITGFPGGPDYARNYLLKAMLGAHLAGMIGLDWFLLSDTATDDGGTDPYSYMGLYHDIAPLSDPSQAVLTDTGTAYATLGSLLGGATVDETATSALALPSGVLGGAFHTKSGSTVVALWASTSSGESATATYSLSASGPVTATAWDHSTTSLDPSSGSVSLSLTSTPQFFALP